VNRVVQFRYTPVQIAPVPKPLFSIVRAVAIIFPSGKRASADQLVSEPLQPDIKTNAPKTKSEIISLRLNELRTVSLTLGKYYNESTASYLWTHGFPWARMRPLEHVSRHPAEISDPQFKGY